MTAVEIGQEMGKRRAYLSLAVAMVAALAGRDDDVAESSVPVRRAATPSTPETGIRFQRCGGGRRVIRRQGGGSY